MTSVPAFRAAWLAASLLVLAYAAIFIAIYLALTAHGIAEPYQMTWWHLRVPALDRTFGDLRTVTHGIDCVHRGIDPYVANPCDPWDRLVNYPPIWLWAFDRLGVGPGITPWLGAAIDLGFVTTAIAFIGRRPLWQGAVYGAALISPAVMMGIERGNNDYLSFALVAAGLALVLRKGCARRLSGTVLLIVALLLKLFPVFSAALVLVRRRSLIAPALALSIIGLLYFVAIRDTLSAIARNTHREVFYSYGAEVLFIGVAKYFHVAGALAWKLPALGAAIAAGLVLGVYGRNGFELRDDRWGAGFAAGAAIFLFSFGVASSFDYRLSFLLLALPQLMDWSAGRDGGRLHRVLATLAVLSILASLWLSFYTLKLHLIDELFNWLSFTLLLAMMTAATLQFATWLPTLRRPG